MKIGILTYNVPHKKTQELVLGLINKGYSNLTLIICNFKKYKNKKKSIFISHRPYQFTGPNYKEIAKYFNLKIKFLNSLECYKGLDIVLVGGSGLIDYNKIKKNLIINCHSGLIPETRGLDSFKWAIFNNRIVGNTLHYINKEVDLGTIISHKVTPLFINDNLDSFAERHYREEINMLINFEYYLENSSKLNLKKQKPTMRIDINKEKLLFKYFENWKIKTLNKII